MKIFLCLIVSVIVFSGFCDAQEAAKELRVLVLTDIENEPDDAMSMVRFLTYVNHWDVEGLVATTSVHQKKKIAAWRIREIVSAYGQVRNNLLLHEKGYPDTNYLRSIIKESYPDFGMQAVGPGKDSEGSEWVIKTVDKNDERPVWVLIWGGPNCLAQALWKVSMTRTPTAFVSSCGNTKTTSSGTNSASTSVATSGESIPAVDWGETDGKKVSLYTLTNKNGVQIKITNYGGIVTSWITPDKNGNKSNIVLGFDSLSRYLATPHYFGAIIGRYGNRIGSAQFKIDTTTYKLAANKGASNLHGGRKGFDKVVWDASPSSNNRSVTLNYLSKDGEEGFPGNLKATVKYTLTDDDELLIQYDAQTDKATPVNLTNHSYFNLTGDVANTIYNHKLWIDADKYTPVDRGMIPTGELTLVKGTPFDFTEPYKMGERIARVPGGYDHNFVKQSRQLHEVGCFCYRLC